MIRGERKRVALVAILAIALVLAASIAVLGATNLGSITTSTTAEFGDAQLDNLTAVDNTVRHGTLQGSSVDLPGFNEFTTSADEGGVVVEPTGNDLGGLEVEMGADPINVSVYDHGTGDLLAWNDTFTGSSALINVNLDEGQEYRIVVETSSNTEWNSSANYPYQSDDIDVVTGWDGSSEDQNNVWLVDNVTAFVGQVHDDSEYINTYTVEDPVNASVKIDQLSNVEISAEWQRNVSGSWETVASETITSTGTHEVDLEGNPADEWRIKWTGTVTGGGWFERLAVMDSESFEFENNDPVASNESPTGGEELNQETVTISLDVNDDDFARVQDEELTVEIYHTPPDGSESLVHTETITQNDTVSTDITPTVGGTHEWRAEIEDNYGGSNSTTGHEFSVPGSLQIYNESAPETLIDDRDINATIFDLDGDEVFERSTTDGNLPTGGLPLDTPLVFQFRADGYETRTLILRTAFEQQSGFMLSESIDSVSPTFVIDDDTGQFDPSSSRVFIERALEIDGDTIYQTISAEEVGTDGYTEALERDVRYRIVIENEDGDRRVLGKYSASATATIRLTVEKVSYSLEAEDDVVHWDFVGIEDDNDELESVRFSFSDNDSRTTDLEVVIYERGNESHEIHNETYSGPLGEISITEPVPSGFETSEWVVEWNAERNPELSSSTLIGPRGILNVPLDDDFKHVIAVGAILIIGGLASQINAPSVGIGVASVAGIMWYIGFLPSAVGGGVIIVGFAIPVAWIIGTSRGV